MKSLVALVLAISLASGCAPATWPSPHESEVLKFCWLPGEPGPRNVLWCNKYGVTKYVQWDHAPLTVSTFTDQDEVLKAAVKTWNFWVGFELFKYDHKNSHADVLIFRQAHYPKNPMVIGLAQFVLVNGRQRGAITIYDGGVGSLNTMAHELGHIVGLRHDPDNIHSIMYPTTARHLPQLEGQDRKLLRDRYLPR